MRKTLSVITVVTIALLVAPVAASAQTVHDEIALSRAQIQSDRQAIVAKALSLNEVEAAVFWPLYRKYRSELDVPLDRAWNLFTTYGDRWNSLSDADAAKMLDEWLAIEKDMALIKQKWGKTIAKSLKGGNAMRFFQVDNKLDTIIRLEAAAEIPLITKAQ